MAGERDLWPLTAGDMTEKDRRRRDLPQRRALHRRLDLQERRPPAAVPARRQVAGAHRRPL